MSGRSSDAKQEKFDALVAKTIGLTVEEFDQVVRSVSAHDSGFGFVVDFDLAADKTVLAKVTGLQPGSHTLNIDSIFDDDLDEED